MKKICLLALLIVLFGSITFAQRLKSKDFNCNVFIKTNESSEVLRHCAITHFSDKSITISPFNNINKFASTKYKVSKYIFSDLKELKIRNRKWTNSGIIGGMIIGGISGAIIGSSTVNPNPDVWHFSSLDKIEPTSKGFLIGSVVGGALGGVLCTKTITIPLENEKLFERNQKLERFTYRRKY